MRHEEQTNADRQRRIIESFSKAVSQLASDKLEERLGGIYTLENISKESPDDYWTVMETLAAFVRERARKKEPAEDVSGTMASFYETQKPSEPGGQRTNIAAVLTVIKRRDEKNYSREREKRWRFDLSRTDLQGADLSGTDLDGLIVYLNGFNAYLDGARLSDTNLSRANLSDAELIIARLTGADLRGAANLTQTQLDPACGNEDTKLPKGLTLKPCP